MAIPVKLYIQHYVRIVNLTLILITILMTIPAVSSEVQESYYMYVSVDRGGYVRIWTNETPLVFNEDLIIKFKYVTMGFGTLSIVLYYEDPVTYSILTKYVEEHLIISRVKCYCSSDVLELNVKPDVENVLIVKIKSEGIKLILNGVELTNCNVVVPKPLRLAIIVKSAPNSRFSIGFLSIITTTDSMEAAPKGWGVVKVGNVEVIYLGKTLGAESSQHTINPALLVGIVGVVFITIFALSKKLLRRISW